MKVWSIWVPNEGYLSFPKLEMLYSYMWKYQEKLVVEDDNLECLRFLVEHHPEYKERATIAFLQYQRFTVMEGELRGHVMG